MRLFRLAVPPFVRTSLAVLLMLAGVSRLAVAQPPGRVNGVVRDEDDDPIKGATVTAQNTGVGLTYTASTDDKGRFVMLGLRTGDWVFIASAPGFAGSANRMSVRSSSNLNAPMLFNLRRNGPGAGGALEKISAKDLQEKLGNAEKLLGQQKWDEAIAAYKAIIGSAEPLAFLNLQVAAAYIGKNDLPRAEAAYEDILRLDPTHDKAIVGVAELKQKQGDIAGALAFLTQHAKAEGTGREVFNALGELTSVLNRNDEATDWFTKASAADPYWARPLYRLGQLAAARGDTAAANSYMNKAIAVDPRSPEARLAKTALGQSGS